MTTSSNIATASRSALVVVESPCAPFPGMTEEHNRNYLARCLRDSLGRNESPIASHGLFAFTGMFNDGNIEERKRCMLAGWAWMLAADKVVVYSDHGITPGMVDGIAFCKNIGNSICSPEIEYRYLDDHDYGPRGSFTAPHKGTPYPAPANAE